MIMNAAQLQDMLERIAIAYPQVAGPNDCPPAPHACDKCEIYYLLAESAQSRKNDSQD